MFDDSIAQSLRHVKRHFSFWGLKWQAVTSARLRSSATDCETILMQFMLPQLAP